MATKDKPEKVIKLTAGKIPQRKKVKK